MGLLVYLDTDNHHNVTDNYRILGGVCPLSFIEVESWQVRKGHEENHDAVIKEWFSFLRKNHSDMFAEWKSARYYREVDHQGLPTGRFIMNFEFYSAEGHDAYKRRRKDWSGPYEEYKRVDPYEHFIEESVKIEYWEPVEEELWLDFE